MTATPTLNNTFGFNSQLNVTNQDLVNIANITDPIQFFGNVNQIVYAGYLFFVLLWVLVAIMYFALQQHRNQPLINAMYAMTIASLLAFILRAINMEVLGVNYSLLTDFQMWIFPISAICLAAGVHYLKDI